MRLVNQGNTFTIISYLGFCMTNFRHKTECYSAKFKAKCQVEQYGTQCYAPFTDRGNNMEAPTLKYIKYVEIMVYFVFRRKRLVFNLILVILSSSLLSVLFTIIRKQLWPTGQSIRLGAMPVITEVRSILLHPFNEWINSSFKGNKAGKLLLLLYLQDLQVTNRVLEYHCNKTRKVPCLQLVQQIHIL